MLPYSTPDSKLQEKYDYWDLLDESVIKQFRHVLDFYIDQKGETGILRSADKSISNVQSTDLLGGFIRTVDDNEDPTLLGFEIRIKNTTSPIFNGELKEFLNTWKGLGNNEIGSRLEILDRFTAQLFKFMKKEALVNLEFGQNGNPEFLKTDGSKSHYIEEIEGLDKLNESYVGLSGDSGSGTIFVDYPKDFITIKFREDVTQNLGYLSSLYKSLSWSRLRGKLLVPENLLRFDCEIVITEIKDYIRIFNNGGTLEKYVDNISKYVYELYECQFFFEKMPHGNTLKMSGPEVIPPSDVKFNYKFATLRFEKMTVDPQNPAQSNSFVIDNKLANPLLITPTNASNASNNSNSITLEKLPTALKRANPGAENGTETAQKLTRKGREGELESVKVNEKIEKGQGDQNENSDAIPPDQPPALAGVTLTGDAEVGDFGQSVPSDQFLIFPNSSPQLPLFESGNPFGQSSPPDLQIPLAPNNSSTNIQNDLGQSVGSDLQPQPNTNPNNNTETNDVGQNIPRFQSFSPTSVNAFLNQINGQNEQFNDQELNAQLRLLDRTLRVI